jgi:glyoxylase-like metal-dependent hydrolase (beta-lactamase superfamily II)
LKIADDVYLVGGGDIRLSSRYDCHVYLIDGGREGCLIDAGSGLGTEEIIANIKKDGFSPKKDIDYILLTHAHSDHGGGAGSIQKATGAKIIAPKGEANFVQEGGADLEAGIKVTKVSGVYPKDYVYQHAKVDKVVEHGSRVKVGKYTLRTIQVPGHSHATAGYLIEQKPRSFFSGDIVFINGTIGLGNWPGCNLDNYRNNIGRLASLSVVQLFPSHFMWTLKDGQTHLDTAIKNFRGAWIPPVWTHNHPMR